MSIEPNELEKIYELVKRKKNEILMQEPCPLYEPEWDNATEIKEDYGTQVYENWPTTLCH